MESPIQSLDPSGPNTLPRDGDIYRGSENPVPDNGSHPPSPLSVASSSSTSSASTRPVRRAIAALVELAVSRWARSTSDASSSTSLGSSRASSVLSTSRRRRRRLYRRTSTVTSTFTITPAQRALAHEALERSRRVPREFAFLLPIPSSQAPDTVAAQRIIRTSSLPSVLGQLETALKVSGRLRKGKQRPHLVQGYLEHGPEPSSGGSGNVQLDMGAGSTSSPQVTTMAPGPALTSGVLSQAPKIRLARSPIRAGIGTAVSPDGGFVMGQKAWWLDVACPTWEDMRAIGTVLHLHPLTLEDILHQEPREKLELFPRLGYYFVVFRALDLGFKSGGDQISDAMGKLNVTNVYLTVFREGICTFHFSDLSQHTDRVRDKVLQLEKETMNILPDHIAYGLMDSVVDGFMPLIRQIEAEVERVDAIIAGTNQELDLPQTSNDLKPVYSVDVSVVSNSPPPVQDKEKSDGIAVPTDLPSTLGERVLSIYSGVMTWVWARGKGIHGVCLSGRWLKTKRVKKNVARTRMLMRMTATRKVVTMMARLLAPKAEVLGQLKKRLGIVADLGAHLGDVQDHILTMQQSLAYYERLLSHSHPAYISILNVSSAQAKTGTDEAIFWLTTVSIATYCMQIIVGVFSMNVHIPGNRRPSPTNPPGTPIGKFRWFGAVFVVEACVAVGLAILIRWWWILAKRKYGGARNL